MAICTICFECKINYKITISCSLKAKKMYFYSLFNCNLMLLLFFRTLSRVRLHNIGVIRRSRNRPLFGNVLEFVECLLNEQQLVIERITPIIGIVFSRTLDIIVRYFTFKHFLVQIAIYFEEEIFGAAVD